MTLSKVEPSSSRAFWSHEKGTFDSTPATSPSLSLLITIGGGSWLCLRPRGCRTLTSARVRMAPRAPRPTAGRCCLAPPAHLLPPGSAGLRAPQPRAPAVRRGVADASTRSSRAGSSGCCTRALRTPGTHFPGAILHVESPALGTWTGAVGLGSVAPPAPMRGADRFRAGSIAKTFVAVVVLQLLEHRPAVAGGPPSPGAACQGSAPLSRCAPDLGSHAARPPQRDPGLAHARPSTRRSRVIPRRCGSQRFLDLAAAQPPLFPPGTRYSYSNTNYNLLGPDHRAPHRSLVAARGLTTGSSARWAYAARRCPPPGTGRCQTRTPTGTASSTEGGLTSPGSTPSIAGAAGGGALVTTVQDLARFLDELLKGRLFRHRETLHQMLAFLPAPDAGGQVATAWASNDACFPAASRRSATWGARRVIARTSPASAPQT